VIKSVPRDDIKSKSYSDLSYKLNADMNTLIEVNTQPLKVGQTIKSYNLDQQIREKKVTAETRGKIYTLVYTTNNRRYLNKLKFYLLIEKDNVEFLTDLIKLGGFKSTIKEMISFHMSDNFLVSMHQGNQVSLFSFYDGIKYIGAINFKFDIISDAGFILYEQKYRISILYVSRQNNGQTQLNIWNIYYLDATKIHDLQKFIFDLKTSRLVQKIDPSGIKLRELYGYSAVSWKDVNNQRLVVRKLGSFKEKWNSQRNEFESCGSNSFNFDPNQLNCAKCSDLWVSDEYIYVKISE
jgi:hypothetical protein